MKINLKRVGLTGLMAALFIIQAQAGENPVAGNNPPNGEQRFEATANRLNLTTEQKEKMKTLRQNQRQEMKALLQSLKEARLKIKEQLDNPNATPEAIAPLAAEAKAILAKMVDKRIAGVFAIRALLTPEQFKQMSQIKQNMGERKRDYRPFWLGKRRANTEDKSQTE